MTAISIDGKTIHAAFAEATARFAGNLLLILPRDVARPYHRFGYRTTYGDAAREVASHVEAFRAAGYGPGHRVACLLANRPETLLLKIALNTLGASWVPLNPDYRPAEMAYVLQDSGADLLIAAPELTELADAAIAESGRAVARLAYDTGAPAPPAAPRPPPLAGSVTPEFEASLLYTSGTTGRPKGCILSHAYELEVGEWYTQIGGLMTLREGQERVYNPLPLFHLNAGIVLFFGMWLSGNCQVVTDRFSARKWWSEIRETGATAAHYLGVVVPALMNRPASAADKDHAVRWAAGAGVEPSLHGPFEARFGFPLVELWGMTEMCRVIANPTEPRLTETRAFGRPKPGLEVRVVDDQDQDVPPGEPGEMVVRHSAKTPRRGAFSGYLNLPEATEAAWRGGWFHTGDVVRQDATGMLFFLDRRKNIIRRSGENIAAAEIEACLQADDRVANVAVLAIEDAARDEEVMACVVPQGAAAEAGLARALFDRCFRDLAYYKAPGWLVFVDDIPVTGTQKIAKHMIFGPDQDPKMLPTAYDFRELKKR